MIVMVIIIITIISSKYHCYHHSPCEFRCHRCCYSHTAVGYSGCLAALLFIREVTREGAVKAKTVAFYYIHRYIRSVIVAIISIVSSVIVVVVTESVMTIIIVITMISVQHHCLSSSSL